MLFVQFRVGFFFCLFVFVCLFCFVLVWFLFRFVLCGGVFVLFCFLFCLFVCLFLSSIFASISSRLYLV